MNIQDYKNPEVFEKIVFTPPVASATGGQSVFMKIDNENLKIQTPRCRLPFGVSSYSDKYYIDLALKKSPEFSQFVQNFDKYIIESGCTHSKDWFKKTLSTEIVDTLYKKQYRTDGTYEKIRAKIPSKKEEFLIDIFDRNNNPVSSDVLVSGCEVQAILECTGVYFMAKEFGTSWRVVQLRVCKMNPMMGYSFVDDDEDEHAEPI